MRKATGVIAGIHKLCARDDFDCSSGIALFGSSMGGGVAVQTSKLLTTPPVNALLTTQFAPLLGGGQPVFQTINPPGGGPYLLPPHPLALHGCGFDDTDQYPPALSTFVDKTKRLSLISAQDFFGNPSEDPATTAPVFSLQRDFSGYDCPDSQNDCTQADGSGYYVVPAGVIPAESPIRPGAPGILTGLCHGPSTRRFSTPSSTTPSSAKSGTPMLHSSGSGTRRLA